MTAQQARSAYRFDRRAIPPEALEAWWEGEDGQRVRRIDWLIPQGSPRGSLLFLPGRADFYEKYLETLDHWHRRGWRVTATDWRGQALSGRLGADEMTGHIDDFAIWVDDLERLWNRWTASTPPPHVLVGHSMGGHLALRAVAERRIEPAALVLAAPMLGLLPQFVPAPILHWIARAIAGFGDPRRPIWRGSERPGRAPEDRFTLLTHDRDRYDDENWWRRERPQLAMGAPSWGWVEAALHSIRELRAPGVLESLDTMVLLLAASADRLVAYDPIVDAARRMARAQLVTFGPEARHEILREVDEVRDRALAAIDDFLDRVAPVRD